MRDYLVNMAFLRKLSLWKIIQGQRENLKYSQMLMNADAQYQDYRRRWLPATFTCSLRQYAHNLGFKADGGFAYGRMVLADGIYQRVCSHYQGAFLALCRYCGAVVHTDFLSARKLCLRCGRSN